MGTKNNPGEFDCYENAEPNEPMFVLLARDPLAPLLVELWATVRATLVGDIDKVREAQKCAQDMRDYLVIKKLKHKIKLPADVAQEVVSAIVQTYLKEQERIERIERKREESK